MFDKINIRHTAAALIIFFSVSIFFQLDKSEIQPWDEGLYAMRALSILNYGNILDQSAKSIGGLYSATYPPLTVWIMAGLMQFLEPHLSVRLFSAVCGSVALLFIFLISRRFLSGEMSLLVIISLAVTVVWNKYSRQGMTDVPLMTFALISLWSLIKVKESEKTRYVMLFALIFTISFAAGLMTKVIVSFLPLLFILFFIKYADKWKKVLMMIAAVLGIALAAPWHIYMSARHGYEFYRVFFAPHIYSSVENNSPVLGAFYYINQMIISNPFLILAIIFLITAIIKKKTFAKWIEDSNHLLVNVLLWWFGAGFIFLSISATKLPHYTLYFILPAIMLSAYFFEITDKDAVSSKIKYLLLSLIIISFLWAISFELRQDIKDMYTLTDFSFKGVFFILIIAFLIVFGFFSTDEKKKLMLKRAFPSISYLILIVLVIKIIFISVIFFKGEIRGGIDTAYYLERSGKKSFVYIYHEHNASDSLNPQLAWYTDGWISGWRKDKTFHPVALPKDKADFIRIAKADEYSKDYLVYYIPNDPILAEVVMDEIKATRHIINRTRNYAVFSPVMFKRNQGLSI